VAVYKLKHGTIETNYHYEVVGASRAYIHLLGRDITDVIHRPEGRAIQRVAEPAQTQQEARLPSVQAQQRRFRQYGKNVLRKRIT
jgi:hypothetical protein